MGRVSDALYFLQKWSTSSIPIPAIVRKASLTWTAIVSPSMSVLNIPYLALLSVALRQRDMPMEAFLTFLIKEGVELTFKSLFQKVSNLTPNLQEIEEVLKGWLSGVGDLLPKTDSFLRRTWSLQAGPLMSIHKRLVNQIMTIQFRIHGEMTFPAYNPHSPLDRAWSFAQPEDDFFGGLMSEQGSPLFRGEWTNQRLIELIRSFSGSSSLNEQSMNILCAFVEEAMLLPRWNDFKRQVQKVLPEYSEIDYLLSRAVLQPLTVSQLLIILEAMIGLETFFTLGSLVDKEQRKAHKVSLRVLASLKPGRTESPSEARILSF